jgi:hypothetical protein
MTGPITLDVKQAGKRSAGKPHAAFDVAGAGNVTMAVGLRSLAKAMELPPAPTVRAPALDPTDEREEETELSQTGLRRRGESPANRHRETTVTAPLLDSTQNPSMSAIAALATAKLSRSHFENSFSSPKNSFRWTFTAYTVAR